MLPMATGSAAARTHATLGQRALDLGHPSEAAEHFREALAADSTFAFGWLGLANASNSLEEYAADLKAAKRFAGAATLAEQLQIDVAQKQVDGDLAGAAAAARRLVAIASRNPRAYLLQATVESAMGEEAQSRLTMQRAIKFAPNFAPAYLQLAYSYILNAPRMPEKADALTRKAIALEPNQSLPYIVSGSVNRALNQLEMARLAYTRAAQFDPDNALPHQQRGHVNTFLGDYDAARADYDTAIHLGKQNEPVTYAVYRAFIPIHAGDPKKGIAELEAAAAMVDSTGVPDPDAGKIFALSSEALVALHVGALDDAQRAIERRNALVRKQEQFGGDEFKRQQEADVAYWEGLLAAKRGDYTAATAKAQEAMRQVASLKSPRRNEQAHALLGVVALDQKKYAEAVKHFEQGNRNDMWVQYQRALALEGAGRTAEAKKLFGDIARYNFNSAGVALVRADSKKRAG
jgi:Flp pilus assembly protein TadD